MMKTLMLGVAALGLIAGGMVVATAHDTELTQTKPETGKLELADFLDFESVGNPQISPDGKHILYTRSRVDAVKDKRASTIWMMNADGSNKRQLMEGGQAVWSPDGSRVLFVKADGNDTPQLHIRHMGDGLVSQLTAMEHAPRSMAWAPDGKSVAFVARVPKTADWTIELPARPKGAEWSPDPVVIDTLHYRQDRVGLTADGFDHIFVVPATGGTPRQLTEGDFNVGKRAIGVIAGAPTLAWSPDSALIAFDGPGKDIDGLGFWESHINVVHVESGEMASLTAGDGVPNYTSPAFSPDGKRIAFTGYPEHDNSYPVPNLYVMDTDGTDMRVLAEDLADGPNQLRFHPNGREVLFTMAKEGARNIHTIDMRGRMRDVTSGDQVVSLSDVSDRGTMVATVSRADRPGAVATITRGGTTLLTDVNADVMHGKSLGKVEEFWYDSEAETGETARVQGWVVKPPDFDADIDYPVLLYIHGGPHAMYNTGFNLRFQQWAADGYVVVYTNPRGSTGYGSDFVNSIRGRYPGALDYADLMNGLDEVIGRGYIDEDRMFVAGCSGGGVLTTHVVAQTDRFAAAAALCPVTNWIGMSGTTDVTGWLYGFFEAPFWEDPQPWLDTSTIMEVGNVETPVLLMTGIEDLRTPLEEAEQYYAALKVRGVPTKLIPMPGEYHGTSSIPSNYLRTHLYMKKWFEEFDPTVEKDAKADNKRDNKAGD